MATGRVPREREQKQVGSVEACLNRNGTVTSAAFHWLKSQYQSDSQGKEEN
jgi:hypothetical protein